MLLKRPKGTVHPEEKPRVATETKRVSVFIHIKILHTSIELRR